MLRALAVLVVAMTLYGCRLFMAPPPPPPPRPPHLLAAPAAHDFGTVLVGSSADWSPGPNWTNDGEQSTRISALDLAGNDPAAFLTAPRTMVARVRPAEVTPTVAVTFAPVKRGAHSATLTPLVNAGSADTVRLSGVGEYVYRDGDFAVMNAGGGIPDPDKPVNCGRIPYTTSVTCTFDVRNDGAAAVNAAITVRPAGGPFALTTPTSPVNIARGATQTITITFTPPAQPPLQTLFTGGVVVSAGTNASGRSLCGVGFRNPAATDGPPPAGTTFAQLVCP